MSNIDIAPKFAEIAELAVNMVEGIKRTGIQVIELRDRYVKLCMPLEGNSNHVGIMYAGSLFTLGEITGGIIPFVALDMTNLVPIVKEVNIRFVAPGTSDVFMISEISEEEAATIQQTASENGKADFRLELELKDANDSVVALVNGLWQVRNMGSLNQ
jgi:acyl-coenzyme A thioesterase PaaI-like protein